MSIIALLYLYHANLHNVRINYESINNRLYCTLQYCKQWERDFNPLLKITIRILYKIYCKLLYNADKTQKNVVVCTRMSNDITTG